MVKRRNKYFYTENKISKFTFVDNVIQQPETVVLEYMPFQALSCKGGTLISICTSRTLILRILGWHLLGSATVIMLPCILAYGGTRLPIDSHIQHIILATEEQRCHNKSARDLSNANPDRGHKELRRSTGHILVKARYSDQQGFNSRQNPC